MNFELGVKKRLSFPYIPLIFVIYSLRQLADFPSLILRLSFAEPSLKVWQILNCELGGI
ncbi:MULTISPECIES: hypothetical protein [Capnocytophaga]|uniref:hypothetical protein n=1 Tax=Capnocytophaga sp. oral taxon 332 TaxID=712213 RepID=UPI0002A3D169|nr:hypothetical protein [Capnocytophaga sp. oral taxon 332]EKY05844.1 hypothetical protein HMPREF9075_02603 [Capnocytophaga sp. oral taxon 332 str. F0381]